jgi:hypothetical protein
METFKKLLVSIVPADCPDDFLKDWIEARGYRTFGVRLIRDQVSGTSPSFAYVQLMNSSRLEEAARTLDGQKLWTHTISVRLVVPMPSIVRSAAWMKAAG